MKATVSEHLASIARRREIGLKQADQMNELLDAYIPDHGKGAYIKHCMVEDSRRLAETEYISDVRRIAMGLMQRDRMLTTDTALAEAEALILEALFE
jgi:hypothetical protein